jgi:hypothetical protein
MIGPAPKPGEPEPGPEQYLILYDKPGQKGVVYSTAYTDRQVEDGIKNCVNQHGRMGTKVRSKLAEDTEPA